MNLLPFGNLPPHRPRRFVPAQVDWNDWNAIAPLFDRLDAALAAAGSAAALEGVLLDWSELHAALDEESSRRYIAMTCHTDNPEAERAYLHFVEAIEPQTKPRQFALQQAFVNHPHRGGLPRPRYEVFVRDTVNAVELFRPENVPLETEETKVGQQYQKLSGSLTVTFRGEEKTLVQMGRYLEEPDRALREEAWRLVAERRRREAETFDTQFDQLATLRGQIARNAGFANYRDYAFKARGRFDYTPADCERFHAAIESAVTPLLRALHADRRHKLGLTALRPWDLAVDPLNRPPLKPFAEVDELVARSQRVFDRLDPELARGFTELRELRLLDLANRK
ncbi:MAG: M3 family metallopeptidase, partial [Limisphaerales bacterium]